MNRFRPSFASLKSSRTTWRVLGYGAFTVVAIFIAFWRSYSSFATYDDEGYVLLSLKEFIRLGGLYHKVYSQYGPFPFELWGAIYKIAGTEVTPDSARVIVIVLWVLLSLLAGTAIERITRSLVTGLVTTIVIFAVAAVITNETLIPDNLCLFLPIAIIAASALGSRHERARLAVIGFLVAALIMTKINMGGAVLLAVCVAIAASSPVLARRPIVVWVFIGLGVLMPFVVLNSELSQGWPENLAVLIALGVAGIGVTLARPGATLASGDDSQPFAFVWFVAAGVVTVIVLAVIVMVLGTSPSDLIQGLITGPLGLSKVFSEAANTPIVDVYLAVAGFACAVISRNGVPWPAHPLVHGLLRLILGLALLAWVGGILPFVPNPDPQTFGIGIPFAWIAVRAPSGVMQDPRQRLTRILIATVPVYGTMLIYPVAGSQLTYAAALFAPLGTLILHDGVDQVRLWTRAADRVRISAGSAASILGLGLLAILGYQQLLQNAVTSANGYNAGVSLPFAGVTKLHQPAPQAAIFEGVVGQLESQCRGFITYPGLNSFYLWTNENPPTGFNVTDWMSLLSASQQQQVVNAVSPNRGLCLLSDAGQAAAWGGDPQQRPLLRFVSSGWAAPFYSNGAYTIAKRSTAKTSH